MINGTLQAWSIYTPYQPQSTYGFGFLNCLWSIYSSRKELLLICMRFYRAIGCHLKCPSGWAVSPLHKFRGSFQLLTRGEGSGSSGLGPSVCSILRKRQRGKRLSEPLQLISGKFAFLRFNLLPTQTMDPICRPTWQGLPQNWFSMRWKSSSAQK